MLLLLFKMHLYDRIRSKNHTFLSFILKVKKHFIVDDTAITLINTHDRKNKIYTILA